MKHAILSFALAAAVTAIPSRAQSFTGRLVEDFLVQPDLSRAEALQRADKLFDMFDLKGDGLVTRHEAKEVGRHLLFERAALHRDVAPGIGGHTLRYLEQRFRTSESVSRQQFEQAMLAHFDEMDTDHNGILTATEREER